MVKFMDKTVRNFNDEELVFGWLTNGVPEGADEDDYMFFAKDESEFAELCKYFVKLLWLENR